MLSTSINKIGKYDEVIFTYQNEIGTFNIGILSNYGAVLNRFEIPFQNKLFNLIQGYTKIEDFKKAYRGVLLAPFPNRIKDGKYNFDDKTYQLSINRPKENNALHGFLYNQSFKIKENKIENDKEILVLTNNYNGDIEGYPFKFSTKITYLWKAPFFINISIEINNTGNKTMPLGLGWHPYFQFPQSIDNINLQMNTTKKFLVDQQMIPTLKTAPYTSFNQTKKIGDTCFDDCFELNNTIHKHQTILTDELNNISITIEQTTNTFGYLQVYTPPKRDAIAIEPMTCTPNAFNNQLGLSKLSPSESYNCSYSIQLKLGSNNL